jgi:hypothetical protein
MRKVFKQSIAFCVIQFVIVFQSPFHIFIFIIIFEVLVLMVHDVSAHLYCDFIPFLEQCLSDFFLRSVSKYFPMFISCV